MRSFSSSAVLHAAPPGIEAVKGDLNYVLHYHPQRSWGKVIFSEACVNNSVHGGGACVVAWGGMHGFIQGGMHSFIRGGIHGFIQGGMCGLIRGGMCGFIRGTCMVLFSRGACMVLFSGGCAWLFQFFRIQ